MTIEQIERAYRAGRISRRMTVRGLVALECRCRWPWSW